VEDSKGFHSLQEFNGCDYSLVESILKEGMLLKNEHGQRRLSVALCFTCACIALAAGSFSPPVTALRVTSRAPGGPEVHAALSPAFRPGTVKYDVNLWQAPYEGKAPVSIQAYCPGTPLSGSSTTGASNAETVTVTLTCTGTTYTLVVYNPNFRVDSGKVGFPAGIEGIHSSKTLNVAPSKWPRDPTRIRKSGKFRSRFIQELRAEEARVSYHEREGCRGCGWRKRWLQTDLSNIRNVLVYPTFSGESFGQAEKLSSEGVKAENGYIEMAGTVGGESIEIVSRNQYYQHNNSAIATPYGLWVSHRTQHRLWLVHSTSGRVTEVVPKRGSGPERSGYRPISDPGWIDGDAETARFHYPYDLTLDADGTALYIADGMTRVRKAKLKTDGTIEAI